jgi:hypothetical protein
VPREHEVVSKLAARSTRGSPADLSAGAEFVIPLEKLTAYAEMTRESGVWNCPTIGVYQTNVPRKDLATLERRPGMAYISPRMRILWKYVLLPGMMQGHTYEGADYPARIAEIYTRMTRALHDSGARVILGTDTDNPYLVPGLSLHEELGYLTLAGLTPYEAIEAGTRNAAEALGRLEGSGTVTVGKRSDLILVEENPHEDVANVSKRAGVMLRGYWLPEAQLRHVLGELMDSYAPSLVERVWPISLIALGVFLIVRRLIEVKGSAIP